MDYTIDKSKVQALEDFIFLYSKEPKIAASSMSDIIGVLIGLKPSAVFDFNGDEFREIHSHEMLGLFDDLGLKILVFEMSRSRVFSSDGEADIGIYVSRDLKTARELHDEFERLWSTMDDLGQVYDREKWESATREIGRLLGYPETAIESFVSPDNEAMIDSEERVARMQRNRYFAHSAEHEKEEREAYDLVLNRVINELAPKTTEILKQRVEAGWV